MMEIVSEYYTYPPNLLNRIIETYPPRSFRRQWSKWAVINPLAWKRAPPTGQDCWCYLVPAAEDVGQLAIQLAFGRSASVLVFYFQSVSRYFLVAS